MNLILKRGVDYTPLIFRHSDLQHKKCYKLVQGVSKQVNSTTLLDFPITISDINLNLIRNYDRNKLNEEYFFSGGIIVDKKIIVLEVYKNSNIEDRYVIIEDEFFKSYPSHLAKLKKYINANGISSRSKMLTWSKDRIYSEFQNLLNPTMKDFDPTIQKELSSKFLLEQRKLIPYKKIDFPDLDMKVGEYGIIIQNTSQSSIRIGSLIIVRRVEAKIYNVELVDHDNIQSHYFQDVRRATQEEIDKYFLEHPTSEKIDVIKDNDYVVILNQNGAIIPIGNVVQVQVLGNGALRSIIIEDREVYYKETWFYSPSSVRLATKEEINKFLSYVAPINESNTLVPEVSNEIGDVDLPDEDHELGIDEDEEEGED
jgi:hypothetical protein